MNATKRWLPARSVDIHVERWVRGRVPGQSFEGHVTKVAHGTRGRLIVTVAAEGQREPITTAHTNLRVRR